MSEKSNSGESFKGMMIMVAVIMALKFGGPMIYKVLGMEPPMTQEEFKQRTSPTAFLKNQSESGLIPFDSARRDSDQEARERMEKYLWSPLPRNSAALNTPAGDSWKPLLPLLQFQSGSAETK